MKEFIKKSIIFLMCTLIPIIVIVGFYVYIDPFKVIFNYNPIVKQDGYTNLIYEINRDYVSTVTLDNNLKDGVDLNSFIFGSSRSGYYHADKWKKYLGEEAKPFHYDASSENIHGIYKKIKYLDEKGVKIKNALIAIEHVGLSSKPKKGRMFIKSPQIMENDNFFEFHYDFFDGFYSMHFLKLFLENEQDGELLYKKPNKKTEVYDYSSYDIKTNMVKHVGIEKKIKDGLFYNESKMKEFYKRDYKDSISISKFDDTGKMYLKEIKKIFEKDHTNYKIVINPLYDQIKFNPEALVFLQEIFGKDNVYDFTGINKYTKDYKNYYEIIHFRPHVAYEILDSIYEN